MKIKEKLNNMKDEGILDPVTDKRRLFKTEEVLSDWRVLVPVLILTFFVVFWACNWLGNFLCNLKAIFQPAAERRALIGFSQCFKLNHPAWVVLIAIALALWGTLALAWNIRTNYKKTNIGQKGVARWSTEKEIREQYKEIPDGHCGDADEFEGGGGVPVHRNGDKLYIDDSPVNNMIIGITRSGKGEMFVFPMLDIYSRAGKGDLSKRASLVISDPKLELYANSFDTLKRRGYDVYCLNLVEPIKSMGYSPLQLIVEAYKQENYDDAEMLANTFAYSVFNPNAGGGNDKFWSTESANLCVAMILAITDDCLREDRHENVETLKKIIDLQDRWDLLNEEEQAEVRQQLKDGVNPYQLFALPPDFTFHPTHKWEQQITMYSVYNTMTELARLTDPKTGHSALDDYFQQRPVGDRGKLKYSAIEVAGDQTKGSIFASCLAELTIFTYNDIAKMTAHTQFDLKDVGFGDKPVAIFLGIPDYDQSNHFIASVFIRQLYFTLAKQATMTKSGKCKREVIFLLDEFGNLPAIEGMESIITVCLGRNIRFDLIIQSYAQIEQKYDKGADTIIGNCSNQIYIATNDKQTAENYSALLGNKTITTVSRSGQKLSLNKSFTEQQEERPLLNSNELMELQEGECVVKRVVKRQDLNHKKVTPTPIFNHGSTAFKYRWQYLQTDDATNQSDLHARSADVVETLNENTARRDAYVHEVEEAEEQGQEVSSVPKPEGKTSPAWLFPSFKTTDDIDYDKTVENTKMSDIMFNIYHFCDAAMRKYGKGEPSGDDKDDRGSKGPDKLPENYKTLVEEAGGDEYARRHTAEKIHDSQLGNMDGDIPRKIYNVMKDFLPGVQFSDPVFQAYTIEDCYWKTYMAYAGDSGPHGHRLTRNEFLDKFHEIRRLAGAHDLSEAERIRKNLEPCAEFIRDQLNRVADIVATFDESEPNDDGSAEASGTGTPGTDPVATRTAAAAPVSAN